MDILVYRAEELESLLKNQTGFWQSVAATMRELPVA
jgi:chaperone required for assembly of F1-ATPase